MDERYCHDQAPFEVEGFLNNGFEESEERETFEEEDLDLDGDEEIDSGNWLLPPSPVPVSSHSRLLTPQEEIALAKRIEQGDIQARQRLIEANYRLVFNVVNQYRYSGVPFEDLVQEGYIGLIQAVDRYDHRRSCRFSTCATIWIRAHILQAIQQLRHLVHVPHRVTHTAQKVWRTAEQMAQELQRWPDIQEIAARMDLPVERVEELLGLAQEWISLDEPLGEEGDTLLLDTIADEEALEPEEVAIDIGLREHLERSLQSLPPREREVIQMRFGLEGQKEHTLAEIGHHFRLSRQRIKEIETSALNKLRCLDCPRRSSPASK